MAKKLEENKDASSRATKKLSEKQKIIQEQAKLIKKKKRRVALKDEIIRIRRKIELMWRCHKGWKNMRRY